MSPPPPRPRRGTIDLTATKIPAGAYTIWFQALTKGKYKGKDVDHHDLLQPHSDRDQGAGTESAGTEKDPMIFRLASLLLALAVAASAADKGPLPIADVQPKEPVNFDRDLLPFLNDNCLACHCKTTTKGGLNMETPELMLKGGETGPGIVPKKVDGEPRPAGRGASRFRPLDAAARQQGEGEESHAGAARPAQALDRPGREGLPAHRARRASGSRSRKVSARSSRWRSRPMGNSPPARARTGSSSTTSRPAAAS